MQGSCEILRKMASRRQFLKRRSLGKIRYRHRPSIHKNHFWEEQSSTLERPGCGSKGRVELSGDPVVGADIPSAATRRIARGENGKCSPSSKLHSARIIENLRCVVVLADRCELAVSSRNSDPTIR
jgi:hypothetical protein